jgi:hypothetical protein
MVCPLGKRHRSHWICGEENFITEDRTAIFHKTEDHIHMTAPNEVKESTYREPNSAANYKQWGAISLFVDVAAKNKFPLVTRIRYSENEIWCSHEVTIASIRVSTCASVVETLLGVSVLGRYSLMIASSSTYPAVTFVDHVIWVTERDIVVLSSVPRNI